MALGTLQYMAPEALTLRAAVDHRADIYAVGVMLYHMLTGRLPQGLFELPSLQVPGLDPRFDTIITRALRNDRARQITSSSGQAEFAAALRFTRDHFQSEPLA
jgi:serine/threonine protein kinase